MSGLKGIENNFISPITDINKIILFITFPSLLKLKENIFYSD